jgi:hypothetical protein
MFVLFGLIHYCLRCVFAPLLSMNRPNLSLALVKRAQIAIKSIALAQTHPLAPLPLPGPRLNI